MGSFSDTRHTHLGMFDIGVAPTPSCPWKYRRTQVGEGGTFLWGKTPDEVGVVTQGALDGGSPISHVNYLNDNIACP